MGERYSSLFCCSFSNSGDEDIHWYGEVAYDKAFILFHIGGWTAICISSWHEYPDSQRQGFGGGPCWGDTEVPLNEIYITYLMKDGTCLRRIIVGSFLSEGQKITRCYSRAESKGWRFVKTNGVVQVDIEESLE